MPLRNPIQEYAWGSHTAIAELLGEVSPSAAPQAELWMGAHPSAPSRILEGAREVALPDAIAHDPTGVLGAEVAARFNGELPFLLKILAAEKPLSLQAHPNAEQARQGYDRDNALGLAPAAPERSYRDARHKPELICALTPFEALVGFRPIPEALARLDRIGIAALAGEVAELSADPTPGGLAAFFTGLLAAADSRAPEIAGQAAAGAARLAGDEPDFAWVARLHDHYPGDLGVLAPILLNRITLEPGEALFLDAGELHAYLGGVGVEVMASSDNVLRGGLTAKHVDPEELGRVLTFRTGLPEVRAPEPRSATESVYATPAAEFELSVLRVGPGREHRAAEERGVEIAICTEGACRVEARDGESKALPCGASVLLPAAAGAYRIGADRPAVLYKASVPRN